MDVWETRRNLKMNVKIKFLNWQSHVPAPDLIGINPNLRSSSFMNSTLYAMKSRWNSIAVAIKTSFLFNDFFFPKHFILTVLFLTFILLFLSSALLTFL